MPEIPQFNLYGEGDAAVSESIQPSLPLRKWIQLNATEKGVILQQLRNTGWVKDNSSEILSTIMYLNDKFLRQCPGKNLHAIKPERSHREFENESKRKSAAHADFEHILVNEKSNALVLRMLSVFLSRFIKNDELGLAKNAKENKDRDRWITEAFSQFDRLANCLNHIFEQFSVNQLVTRNGFVPRQDEKITSDLYVPVLKALSDPKWRPLNDDLVKMFQDFSEQKYSETITKAHAAVQRFLQIVAGVSGKNGRGEVGKLFQDAKRSGSIPANQFSESFINAVQSAIVAERATNSTAKPTVKEATSSDALLTMNLVMIFLQHCLTR